MFNLFKPFDVLTINSNGIVAYNPYINYTWEMLPNAKVKNSGTSGVDLQLYSGNPLDFQGSQYVLVPNSINPTQNISVVYTLRLDTSGSYYHMKSSLFISWNSGLIHRIYVNGVNYDCKSLVIGTTYNIAITLDNGALKIYYDGIKKYEFTVGVINNTSHTMSIFGETNGTSLLDGQSDMFIKYHGILTQTQIQQSVEQPNQFFKDMNTNSNTLFATDFRGNSSNIKDYKSGMTYPIINYSATQRTNFTKESKGLQDLTRLFDSNGFFLDNTDYLNCNGKGKATVIEPSRTSKVTIQTNPTILSGNILSGGVTLTTAGLTVGIDNDIVLDNQAISSNIDIGVGYKGKVTIYKEDLL